MSKLDRSSIPVNRNTLAALGVAGVFGVAWLSGTHRAQDRFASEAVAHADAGVVQVAAAAEPFRLATEEWDIANIDHPRIDFWIQRFTTDKRGDFTRFLERSGRYGPMIQEQLAARDMPQDLIYLAMIESGMNPTAYSHAHASGLWQFISETGQRYGLTVNQVVDERNDPVKSTEAALDYLTYLKNRLGSWYLAAAGYNTGENRVARLMRETTGSEAGKDEDFYRIWDRLPRETRDYVPLMVAAARISKDPAKYGFEDVEFLPPLEFDVVEAAPGTRLEQVARAVGVTAREITSLNPHLRRGHVPTNRSYAIRLPTGSGEAFAAFAASPQNAAQLAQAPAGSASHTVRRGESLSVIASRHGVSVSALRSENNLRGDRIVAGSTLQIPAR